VGQLLLSGTLITAFLGGVVALLAPCCISVMLPAYFATSFHRRVQLVGMTLVFAVGIATVILPIGLGASAISRLLVGQHRTVFTIGGVLLVAAGIAMIAGWKFMLPMPGRRGGTSHGIGSVYALGLFSGAASACCAPVLAGVAALSGAAASFPVALTVGAAYVFGMVAPLAVLALVWDRRDWGHSRIFGNWGVTIPVGSGRRIGGPALLSGGLLAAMGVLTIVLAFRGPAMQLSGWQLRVSAWPQHISAVIGHRLTWLPGWAAVLLLVAGFVALLRATRRRGGRPVAAGTVAPVTGAGDDPDRPAPPEAATADAGVPGAFTSERSL